MQFGCFGAGNGKGRRDWRMKGPAAVNTHMQASRSSVYAFWLDYFPLLAPCSLLYRQKLKGKKWGKFKMDLGKNRHNIIFSTESSMWSLDL